MDKTVLVRLTAEVVSSYVGNPSFTEGELDRAIEKLPQLIDRVHDALIKIMAQDDGSPVLAEPPAAASRLEAGAETLREVGHPAPATPVEQSVFADRIICLEDGKSFKTLARHLRTHHGMTPDAYRAKWNLPSDYPMACAAFAKSRSDVAKRIGLGVDGRGSPPAFVKPAATRRNRRPV